MPWRGEGVVSSRKTQDPNEKPPIGHISVDQTMELCVLHLKKQKLKSKQGMRNWVVRRNIRLKTMWATNEDSDDEVEVKGGSPECDIDENEDTARQGHLLYRDHKSTHKYGLEMEAILYSSPCTRWRQFSAPLGLGKVFCHARGCV